jgi:hypothetical protein
MISLIFLFIFIISKVTIVCLSAIHLFVLSKKNNALLNSNESSMLIGNLNILNLDISLLVVNIFGFMLLIVFRFTYTFLKKKVVLLIHLIYLLVILINIILIILIYKLEVSDINCSLCLNLTIGILGLIAIEVIISLFVLLHRVLNNKPLNMYI